VVVIATSVLASVVGDDGVGQRDRASSAAGRWRCFIAGPGCRRDGVSTSAALVEGKISPMIDFGVRSTTCERSNYQLLDGSRSARGTRSLLRASAKAHRRSESGRPSKRRGRDV